MLDQVISVVGAMWNPYRGNPVDVFGRIGPPTERACCFFARPLLRALSLQERICDA